MRLIGLLASLGTILLLILSFYPSKVLAADYTILLDFGSSSAPASGIGSLVSDGTALYGTGGSFLTVNPGGTDYQGSGAIFKVNPDGTGYVILHAFGDGTVANDGKTPTGGLTLVGSTLYGMTSDGGKADHGTIFKINTDGSGYAILHSFGDGTIVNDGVGPTGKLTLVGSTLYGTTSGGTASYGTVFKINTDGTGYAILHLFNWSSDSANTPRWTLAASGSTLYGTTYYSAGNIVSGVIFKINTDGTGYAILHTFGDGSIADDGEDPAGSLTLVGSTLYGMTSDGGNGDYGTIFKINTDGSGYAILHSFGAGTFVSDNLNNLSLTPVGSTLYGMAENESGTPGNGVIFKINTDGTGYVILHAFGDGSTTNDGITPAGSLTLAGSTLYGMTTEGGTNYGGGTLFSLGVPSTGGLWQNATPTGGGWQYLSPFGAFNTNSSPWIYHQTLGWLYPVGTSTDSIWFYDPQWDGTGGWWWTSSSFFPWLYSVTENEWLYYDVKDSTLSTRWFFTCGGQPSTH